MPTIKTQTGNINRRSSSASVSVFHSPRKGEKKVEKFINVMAKTANVHSAGLVTSIGSAQFAAAIPGVKPEIGGRFVTASYEIAEGEILKIHVNVRPGYGTMEKCAAFYIRMRDEAAYRVVTIPLLTGNDLSYEEAKIEGNFDMLTVEQARAEGVLVKKKFEHLSEAVAVERVIGENTVVVEERSAQTVKEVKEVTNQQTGEVVTFVRRKRRRALEL